MLLNGLMVDDISGGGEGETTLPPKSKIFNGKRKREKEEEEEKGEEDDEKEKTKDRKRVRRGGEGREEGRGARWRLGRHIENVSACHNNQFGIYNMFILRARAGQPAAGDIRPSRSQVQRRVRAGEGCSH